MTRILKLFLTTAEIVSLFRNKKLHYTLMAVILLVTIHVIAYYQPHDMMGPCFF